MEILGIDYGDKRIGLSLAARDSIAVPYKIIHNIGLAKVLVELKDIIKAEEIKTIVIGLPHSLSGEKNQRLEITQKFVDYLKENLDLAIDTVDEQFTSQLYAKQG